MEVKTTSMIGQMIGLWTEAWAKKNKVNCKYLPETTSTNDVAKNLTDLEFYDVIVADLQTAGRGRGSNTWTSATPGAQLFSSWIFDVKSPPQPIISPLLGLAIYKSLRHKFEKLLWNLKAPNDIYLNNKKVGGILVESISVQKKHRVIVGFGLNVFDHPKVEIAGDVQTDYPKQILDLQWEQFLTRLHFEIKSAVNQGLQLRMSPISCQEVCTALNLNPQVKNPYLMVAPDGSLKTKDKTIKWSDL